jgi:hypothetical protein
VASFGLDELVVMAEQVEGLGLLLMLSFVIELNAEIERRLKEL